MITQFAEQNTHTKLCYGPENQRMWNICFVRNIECQGD